jgi:hypothetical protein
VAIGGETERMTDPAVPIARDAPQRANQVESWSGEGVPNSVFTPRERGDQKQTSALPRQGAEPSEHLAAIHM